MSVVVLAALTGCESDDGGRAVTTVADVRAPLDALAVEAAPDARTDARTDAMPDAGPDASPDAAAPPTCNGSAATCDRRFNDVAQACTHNAMSSKAYRFIIPTPNQVGSLTQQLDDGVRCLMLDTFEESGELMLCHGVCGNWGRLKLAVALDEISAWLEAHPREIVTFILEAYITEAQTLSALTASGLAGVGGVGGLLYQAAGPPGTPWPILGDMIEADQRLVVFTDDPQANGVWHLHWPTFGWETPYNDPTFTCAHGRGQPTAHPNQVFILNHYSLGPAGGNEPLSTENNTYDSILEHARRCREVSVDDNPNGQRPTFINVDHYQVPTEGGQSLRPDVIDAVEALNAE